MNQHCPVKFLQMKNQKSINTTKIKTNLDWYAIIGSPLAISTEASASFRKVFKPMYDPEYF